MPVFRLIAQRSIPGFLTYSLKKVMITLKNSYFGVLVGLLIMRMRAVSDFMCTFGTPFFLLILSSLKRGDMSSLIAI